MSDYLIHYGVPGMKWGIRKSRPASGMTKQQKKKAKVEKYRNKLAGKSRRYEQYNINSARKEHEKYKDLKRYGRKSGTWLDHLADQWENDTLGNERLEKYSPRTQQALKRLDIAITDRLTTDAEFNKYMRDITIERDASSRRARQWAQTSKDLENMTIDELTTKRDVRKVFRNGH